MGRRRIPRVIDEHLQPFVEMEGSQPGIRVGSASWYAWLNDLDRRSFAFRSAQGTLTARRERHHGNSNWYWYAYRTRRGQLHKAYLGRSEELTAERLRGVAATLTREKTTGEEQELTGRDTSSPYPLDAIHRVPTLNTKLYIPPPVQMLVVRTRLIARLAEGVRHPVTLLSAPAGWGKTTLLSAWHADSSGSGPPVAWVSLDAGDNDPVRFWTYVITALSKQYAGIGENALALLRSSQSPSITPVLTVLLNALADQPVDVVLVLDGYHVIETQAIHSALAFLLEHLPLRLHLVIATRFDPPIPLSRFRVHGALTEIRAADLHFTPDEAATFLAEAMGLPLSAEHIARLVARTEGWIAGLQLAALSLQGRPIECLPRFVEAFSGSDRYVLEYLVEEVLGQQSNAIQTFLLRTSVLDRMCAPLCEALLTGEQGEADASQSQRARVLLEHLEQTNLFLVPLDEERCWYRYHQLFADVLRSLLQQNQPTLSPELHRRASAWYEQNGLFAEAVEHALAAHDLEHAVRLIEPRGYLHTHPKPLQTLLDPLSERELEVLSLLAGGASNSEIGGQLVVEVSTVKRHVSNIFSKLSANSRTQAVARAREIGLL